MVWVAHLLEKAHGAATYRAPTKKDVTLVAGTSGSAYGVCVRMGSWLLHNYFFRGVGIMLLAVFMNFLENVSYLLLIPLVTISTGRDASNVHGNAATIHKVFRTIFGYLGVPLDLLHVLLAFILVIYAKSLVLVLFSLFRSAFILAVLGRARFNLVNSVMSSGWSFAKTVSPGIVANLATSEMQRVNIATAAVINLSVAIIASLAYLVAALSLNWMIVTGVVGVAVVGALVTHPLLKYAYNHGFKVTAELNRFVDLLVQAIHGMKILKAMNAQDRVVALIGDANDRNIHGQFHSSISSAFLKRLQEPLMATLLVIIVFVGIQVLKVDFSILAVLLLILARLSATVWSIQQTIQQVGNMAGSVASVFGMIAAASDAKEQMRSGGAQVVFWDKIAYECASFAYGNDEFVLREIDLDIPARGLTVLSGPSGSGKTTVVDGLLQFLPCAKGRITLDGVDLRDIDVSFWRSQIGYLPQDVLLFTDTVRRNVTLGDNSISDEAVKAALRKAEIWDFIENCPGGLDYQVAESGNNLSGGQRQRIALARALVRDAHLLILDEVTSALDEANRGKIIETISTLAQSIAVLAVTHDEALVKAADRVYLIDNGTASPMVDAPRAVATT